MFVNSPLRESEKLQYLRTFRQELDGLIQSFDDKKSLLAVLRRTLEEDTPMPVLPQSLQGRVSVITRMSEESKTLGAVYLDVKTMLLSRIEALESGSPEDSLRELFSKESSLFEDFPNEILARAFEYIPEKERTLRVRKDLIRLFEKSNDHEACLESVGSTDSGLRARVIANALSFYSEQPNPPPEKLMKTVGLLPIEPFRQSLRDLFVVSDLSNQEDILKIITSTPEEQRIDVMKNLRLLFLYRSTDNGSRRKYILKGLGRVPADQRSDVLEKATPLIREIPSGAKCSYILQGLGWVPADQRSDVLEKAMPLLHKLSDSMKYFYILEGLGSIPADQRSDVLEKATPLLHELSDPIKCSSILQGLGSVPADQRTDVLEKATPLLHELSDPIKCSSILQGLGSVPADQRTDVLEKATPLLHELSDPKKCFYILQGLGSIPADQRVDVLEKATPLLHKLSDPIKCSYVLQGLGSIPADQRTDVLEKAMPLLHKLSDPIKCSYVLRGLGSVPADQRTDVLEKATSLLHKLSDSIKYFYILQGLGRVPADQRTDVLEKAMPLLHKLSDPIKCSYVLRGLGSVPADQRVDVLEKATSLIHEIPDGEKCSYILRGLGKIPADQRVDVLEKATPLLKTSNEDKCEPILKSLAEIPGDLRSLTFETIAPLLQELTDGYQQTILLKLFTLLPENQRTSFISDLDAFKTGAVTNINSDDLSRLSLLPPERRRSLFQLLNVRPDLLQGNVLNNLFSFDSDLKQASIDYVSQEIERAISSPEQTRLLSKSIIDAEEILGLHAEHPLFQRAIEILCLTDPDVRSNRKNPYRIYNDLVDFAKTEPLINLPLPIQEIEGIRACIDIEGFRASALQASFTAEDIPEGIPPDSFHALFRNLEGRLAEAPGLSEEIQHSYEFPFAKLKENIVNGATVSGLLQIPTHRNESVREASLHLYSILQAVLRTSSARKEGDLLSDQERALLSFAHATTNCRTGQLDGIALYYNALPLEFRMRKEAALTPSQERLKNVLDTFIQSALNNTFASEEFLRLAGGQEALSQESHQTLYVKNRLFKHAGLKHFPTFDLNTGILSDALLQASPDSLLENFFLCCSPVMLTKLLQEELNRSLVDPSSGLLKPLDDFFDLQVSEGFGNKETWIVYREESDRIEVTRMGTLIILENFGYITHKI